MGKVVVQGKQRVTRGSQYAKVFCWSNVCQGYLVVQDRTRMPIVPGFNTTVTKSRYVWIQILMAKKMPILCNFVIPW